MRRDIEKRPIDDDERAEMILEVLDRIADIGGTVLVEGVNDVRSLESVGVEGPFFTIQCSGGPVKAVEHLESTGDMGIVLTDWDRRGCMLARRISEMAAGSCTVDLTVRRDLARLCSCYFFDVESLGPWLTRKLTP